MQVTQFYIQYNLNVTREAQSNKNLETSIVELQDLSNSTGDQSHIRAFKNIIINNLVASSLWHRLAVLEPPAGLLGKLQSIIVDFFLGQVYY